MGGRNVVEGGIVDGHRDEKIPFLAEKDLIIARLESQISELQCQSHNTFETP